MTTTTATPAAFVVENRGWDTATPDYDIRCKRCSWFGNYVVNGRFMLNGVETFARRYARLSFPSYSAAVTHARANHVHDTA